MKTTWMFALALALLPVRPAAADMYDPIRAKAEASMLVTGVIDIDAQGTVQQFKLDDRDLVPVDVVNLVERAVPAWRFEPLAVEGKPTSTTSKITMRLLLRSQDGRNTVGIVGANLTELDSGDGRADDVKRRRVTPPKYPAEVARRGIGGIVYLLIGLDSEGNAKDIFVEQVNMTTIARPDMMEWAQKSLSEATVSAARQWTFTPSLAAKTAGQRDVVRMPIAFSMDTPPKKKGYRWEAYIPGPISRAPWLDAKDAKAGRSDALAPGEVSIAGTAPTLLTPLDAG